jgi:hypothetical protein
MKPLIISLAEESERDIVVEIVKDRAACELGSSDDELPEEKVAKTTVDVFRPVADSVIEVCASVIELPTADTVSMMLVELPSTPPENNTLEVSDS